MSMKTSSVIVSGQIKSKKFKVYNVLRSFITIIKAMIIRSSTLPKTLFYSSFYDRICNLTDSVTASNTRMFVQAISISDDAALEGILVAVLLHSEHKLPHHDRLSFFYF